MSFLCLGTAPCFYWLDIEMKVSRETEIVLDSSITFYFQLKIYKAV